MSRRTEARKDLPVDGRVTLLEDDLDGLENAVHEQTATLSRLLWAVVTLIITVATAVFVFALTGGTAHP